MNAKVQKWGNSLALRIPKALAEETRLSQGATVSIEVNKGRLVIEPEPVPRYSLSDLLKGVTSANRHEEISTGGPVGKEQI